MNVSPFITCEHAGNQVPAPYGHFFDGHHEVLQSHRGWDPGALEVAQSLANRLAAPLWICETTRLLVEPNRSLHHHALFSEFVQALNPLERDRILAEYYFPHRNGVENLITHATDPVLHLSIHSFTPVFNNVVRAMDIGLLFDPDREHEMSFCAQLHSALTIRLPHLKVVFNEPYKGIDDGFTTYLRTRFAGARYMGIEVEINQKHVGGSLWKTLINQFDDAVLSIIHQ